MTSALLRALTRGDAAAAPPRVEVIDVSGGCGEFFRLVVRADALKGLSRVQAHRLVLDAIEADVGKIHGLTIDARAPDA